MNTTQRNKKEQILDVINKIDNQNKQLAEALEKVYTQPQNVEHEKEFISSCNYLQMLARQALGLTGYYKSLSGTPRPAYAPEELEGDESDISNLVSIEMTKIEKEVEEGNATNPICANDITKEEWFKAMDNHKIQIQKVYDEHKEVFDADKDKSFWPYPVETTILFDDEIINAAKGFMIGPVGLFKNKAVEAETQTFDSLHEMKIFLLNVQCKTRDMVLYMTFEQCGRYLWRGAFVHRT